MTTKIVYVHGNSNIIAGQEKSLINIAKGINKNKFEPIVILPQEGIFAELLRNNGIRIKIIKLSRFRKRNPFPFIITVFKLFFFVKKEKIKIIHTSGLYPNQYCVIVARLAKIPCICHIRSTIYNAKEIKNSLLKFANITIAVSKGVKRKIKECGVEDIKIKVIYNGIDPNDYNIDKEQIDKIREKFNIDKSHKIIGQIGQIVEHKGIFYFIKMAEIIVKQMQNVRFMLVGDDKYKPGYMKEMKKLVKELKLDKYIIFTGFRQDIPMIISMMDITILSSLIEGFGNVILEAMWLGKPVIATDIPGPNEIIENNITGILVPPRDYKAMAGGVLTLLNDKVYTEKLIKNAKNKVIKEFSLREHIKLISNVYESLIEH